MKTRDPVDSAEYAQAFERNCPDARLTEDERYELQRLFGVCISHARSAPRSALSAQPQDGRDG